MSEQSDAMIASMSRELEARRRLITGLRWHLENILSKCQGPEWPESAIKDYDFAVMEATAILKSTKDFP